FFCGVLLRYKNSAYVLSNHRPLTGAVTYVWRFELQGDRCVNIINHAQKKQNWLPTMCIAGSLLLFIGWLSTHNVQEFAYYHSSWFIPGYSCPI
ncbi:MAG: hypothetical protein MUP03_11180, partial [Anaerolineales bacterium]|nr:hypothetical protein [Anaerolineales bacterium]